MPRAFNPLLAPFGALLAVVPALALAQAVVPEDHPGFALAQEIAARGCVLHQDDVNEVMEAAGLEGPAFPQSAVPLMRDGYLMSTGNGTLTLVNWGLCPGPEAIGQEAAAEPDADGDAESTGAETE